MYDAVRSFDHQVAINLSSVLSWLRDTSIHHSCRQDVTKCLQGHHYHCLSAAQTFIVASYCSQLISLIHTAQLRPTSPTASVGSWRWGTPPPMFVCDNISHHPGRPIISCRRSTGLEQSSDPHRLSSLFGENWKHSCTTLALSITDFSFSPVYCFPLSLLTVYSAPATLSVTVSLK